MTTMWVANVTAQFHVFMYRVAENPKLIQQEIPPGGQIRIAANGGNLNPSDIESIVSHHAQYGMIAAADVGRHKGYLGLVYSLDRTVNLAKIQEQVYANREILTERGRDNRRAAAVAVSQQVEAHIAQEGLPDVLKHLEISVEEIKGPKVQTRSARDEALQRDLEESAPVAEGIRVTRDADAPKPSRRGGRRRAA